MCRLQVRAESWPIAGRFVISRGAKTQAQIVLVEISEGDFVGRGECVPYARYGETIEGTLERIESLRPDLERGMTRDALQSVPPGAARNALDCALWDLEAKRAGRRVWELAGLPAPGPVTTAYTLSLDSPEAMAAEAKVHGHRPILKMKLGGGGDLDRVRAVHAGAPRARLIVDANEAWTAALYAELAPALSGLGVELIEQPLPAGDDEALRSLRRPVPVCADESCHDSVTLGGLAGKYDAVNVKLDKTGGLTEALRVVETAKAMGLGIMVGCMVATSLSMAPAHLVAQAARWVDLDGPLLLAKDREPGLDYSGSSIAPPSAALWG